MARNDQNIGCQFLDTTDDSTKKVMILKSLSSCHFLNRYEPVFLNLS